MDQGQGPVAEEYPGDQAEESGDENPLWEKGQAVSYIAITADHAKLRKVRKRLRRSGCNAYLPAIVAKRIIPKGRKLRHRRHVLPLMSYVLVEAPSQPDVFDLWLYSVLTTKDVRGYVKVGDMPAIISQASVDVLKAGVKDIRFNIAAARHRTKIGVGSRSAIKAGSFTGRVGTVQWINEKKAGLETMLFGSMRVVEVDVDNLEAA